MGELISDLKGKIPLHTAGEWKKYEPNSTKEQLSHLTSQ